MLNALASVVVCSALFFTPISTSQMQVQNALSSRGIPFVWNDAALKTIEKWDSNDSSSIGLEILSTKLIQTQKKKDQKFFSKLKIFFLGGNGDWVLQQRIEALALAEALKKISGFKENTSYEVLWKFQRDHHNKIQILKGLLYNSIFIHFFGIPMYLPTFDTLSFINLEQEDYIRIKRYGLLSSIDYFKEKYKKELSSYGRLEKIPRVLTLSIILSFSAYTMYAKIDEVRHEPPIELITEESAFFRAFEKEYLKTYGRSPDLNQKEDLEQWQIQRSIVFRAWVDLFLEKYQRYPDLKKDLDFQEFQKAFLQEHEASSHHHDSQKSQHQE